MDPHLIYQLLFGVGVAVVACIFQGLFGLIGWTSE